VEQDPAAASREENTALHINPYTVAEHGWRGLTIPGNRKRKWYTVLHNDKVLVTALITGIPGEYSLRHSHESGELSIHYTDDMHPQVTWNPPGVLHGGLPEHRANLTDAVAAGVKQQEQVLATGSAEVEQLVGMIMDLQQQMQDLQRQLREALRPSPGPRVIIDIIFPPFRTTVDDPVLPETKVVTGQWFD
jgi:hypothetical protein